MGVTQGTSIYCFNEDTKKWEKICRMTSTNGTQVFGAETIERCLQPQYGAVQIRNESCSDKSLLTFEDSIPDLDFFHLENRIVSDAELERIMTTGDIGYSDVHPLKDGYQVWVLPMQLFIGLVGDEKFMCLVNYIFTRGYVYTPEYGGEYIPFAKCPTKWMPRTVYPFIPEIYMFSYES